MAIKETLLSCLSMLEFEFDISEEEYLTKESQKNMIMELSNCEKDVVLLRNSFNSGQAYTKGLKVSFIGKPNVGKSTLVNKIISVEKSITSDIPGTTRDLVLTEFVVEGVPVTFIDTAGIHDTKDEIEVEGIKRSIYEARK